MKRSFKNLVGRRFGRLKVLSRAVPHVPRSRESQHGGLWTCLCNCGTTGNYYGAYMADGDTKSCGCITRSHGGLSKTHVYKTWVSVKSRCYNPQSPVFKWYGGRGIKMCRKWKGPAGFIQFAKDMGQPPSSEHELDRINNNLGYNKANCRWVTHTENCRNKRNNILVTYRGETLCLKEWADRIGITKSGMCRRYHQGWPLEKMMAKRTFTTSKEDRAFGS